MADTCGQRGQQENAADMPDEQSYIDVFRKDQPQTKIPQHSCCESAESRGQMRRKWCPTPQHYGQDD